MDKMYVKRIARLAKLLTASAKNTAALISSNPVVQKSHDQNFPYRPNSNLLYLTGAEANGLLLLVRGDTHKVVLLAPPRDKLRELWEGAVENPKRVAARIGADLVVTGDPVKEVLARLHGAHQLYYQNIAGSLGAKIAGTLLDLRADTQSVYPKSVSQLDLLMQQLRLYKDPEEVRQISRSVTITAAALTELAPLIQPGRKEWQIARTLEYYFAANEARPGFETIVATGPSAATLHYTKLSRTLKEGELLLIDCGAEQAYYSADITRTFPVGGEITLPVLRDLYDAVQAAQEAAISAVGPGVLIREVYEAAAAELTRGLRSAGVLRGPLPALLKKKAYKPYFPHGIGHSLGLDVHDIGPLRGNSDARLEKGMVFTIEPGLYFSKRVGKVPACGIRIEDDVLVTARGAKILGPGFPTELSNLGEMVDDR
jgi:Xaa-Pro aminopeptidase